MLRIGCPFLLLVSPVSLLNLNFPPRGLFGCSCVKNCPLRLSFRFGAGGACRVPLLEIFPLTSGGVFLFSLGDVFLCSFLQCRGRPFKRVLFVARSGVHFGTDCFSLNRRSSSHLVFPDAAEAIAFWLSPPVSFPLYLGNLETSVFQSSTPCLSEISCVEVVVSAMTMPLPLCLCAG